MQEIIVYRSPAEAAIWRVLSTGEFFPIIVGACVALAVFLVIMQFERRVPYRNRGKLSTGALIVGAITWIMVSWFLLSKLV